MAGDWPMAAKITGASPRPPGQATSRQMRSHWGFVCAGLVSMVPAFSSTSVCDRFRKRSGAFGDGGWGSLACSATLPASAGFIAALKKNRVRPEDIDEWTSRWTAPKDSGHTVRQALPPNFFASRLNDTGDGRGLKDRVSHPGQHATSTQAEKPPPIRRRGPLRFLPGWVHARDCAGPLGSLAGFMGFAASSSDHRSVVLGCASCRLAAVGAVLDVGGICCSLGGGPSHACAPGLRMFAGEVLVALPLLHEFAKQCVVPAGWLPEHTRCLQLLAVIVNRLFGSGDAVLRELDAFEADVQAHHALYVRLYPIRPKVHSALHVRATLAHLQANVNSLCLERKHQEVRKAAAELYGRNFERTLTSTLLNRTVAFWQQPDAYADLPHLTDPRAAPWAEGPFRNVDPSVTQVFFASSAAVASGILKVGDKAQCSGRPVAEVLGFYEVRAASGRSLWVHTGEYKARSPGCWDASDPEDCLQPLAAATALRLASALGPTVAATTIESS